MNPDVTSQVGVGLKTSVDLLIGFGSDFIAFIVVAAAVAVFAFYFGRDRLVPLIAGLLAAIPLYTHFPFMTSIGSDPWLNTGLYVVMVIVGLVAFSGLQSWVPTSGVGIIKILALSAIAAGIVLAVAINVLPVGQVYVFSEPTRALFASNYFFYWLVAGLAGVLFLGR